jgi:hypothetical protein
MDSTNCKFDLQNSINHDSEEGRRVGIPMNELLQSMVLNVPFYTTAIYIHM